MNWVAKEIKYEGMWEFGRMKGLGKLIYANGEVKEGYFLGMKIFKSEEEMRKYFEY
jgi:hypothetical protein